MILREKHKGEMNPNAIDKIERRLNQFVVKGILARFRLVISRQNTTKLVMVQMNPIIR